MIPWLEIKIIKVIIPRVDCPQREIIERAGRCFNSQKNSLNEVKMLVCVMRVICHQLISFNNHSF